MLLLSAAQTDVGLVRSENEDCLLCADNLRLYAVADGIGGLPCGAEAAQLAISTLNQQAHASVHAGKPIDLDALFHAANDAVIELGHRFAPDVGLGSTLTAALFVENTLHVANVGDSRCYLLRNGVLQLLTTDDTMEQEVIQRRARGEIVRLEERHRNALTRCIGQPMPLSITVTSFPVHPGDRFLICSDGITRMLPDEQICRRLVHHAAPELALGALIADALARGGRDNATGIVVDVHGAPASA